MANCEIIAMIIKSVILARFGINVRPSKITAESAAGRFYRSPRRVPGKAEGVHRSQRAGNQSRGCHW